ncbi:MAG TPA: MFS transporter [Saprospiraceae bacterium]|nr:MFS transporter [Saprospiraceae bacterium]
MKGIKFKLTILNFLEFFIFGSWLLSFGKYMFVNLHFTGTQIGAIFMTLGFASLIMPGIMGIIADKWSPNKLFALSHLVGAALLYNMAQQPDYDGLFWASLFYLMLYMPSIGLDNTISYCLLERNDFDVVKVFPPIRVWGTIGFIIATWITDSFGWGVNANQFYFAAVASIVLGLFTLTLPDCAREKSETKKKTFSEAFGLDAFKLFANYKMATFFIFAMLLGAALQITNMFGEAFLHDFGNIEAYKDTFAVKHNGWLMSLSQISETVFILTIPFFLKKFGIKKVMLMSMFAWFLRFLLFGVGSPVGLGLIALILSMIVYGMAFDFFNISGSLFVEQETDKKIRGSAQGLFIMMTNGFGAMIGAYGSGYVVDLFTKDGVKDWTSIWYVFAVYSLVLVILFAVMFKYKHDPAKLGEIKH